MPPQKRGHHQKDENALLSNLSSAAGGEIEITWCFEPEG